MKIYAFDVDETLEVSQGPVLFGDLLQLKAQGHLLGICGNFAMVTMNVPWWPVLFSFIGQGWGSKPDMLAAIKAYVPAEEYVMVGNDPAHFGGSNDVEAARLAGWRFIREHDFARGVR